MQVSGAGGKGCCGDSVWACWGVAYADAIAASRPTTDLRLHPSSCTSSPIHLSPLTNPHCHHSIIAAICRPLAVTKQGKEAEQSVSDFVVGASAVHPVLIISYEMVRVPSGSQAPVCVLSCCLLHHTCSRRLPLIIRANLVLRLMLLACCCRPIIQCRSVSTPTCCARSRGQGQARSAC